MTDEDLRWCDVCDDCSHYKAVGDEKYQCTLEGGRCRGYFAYKKLKAEHAELRERLSRAVELPVKVGDTVYLLSQTSRCPKGEIIEAKIIDFIGWEDGYRFTAKEKAEWFSFLRGDIGTWVFTTREAAEARLAELKGGSND